MRKPIKEQTPPWHLLFGGIAFILAVIVIIIKVGPVLAWSFTYNCDDVVYGSVTVGNYNQPFTVSLQDHVPGDAQFKPVPGSGQVLNPPFSNPVYFGPLDTANVRPNANSIRIVTTATNEKSESFPPCFNPTPPPTPSPSSSATPTPSSPPTPAPSASPTPTFTPSTSVSPTPTPAPEASSTPASLPNTGGMPDGRTLPSEYLILGIVTIIGFAWYRVLKGTK